MRRALAAFLVLCWSTSTMAGPVTSLRMRPEDDLDSFFDGSRPAAGSLPGLVGGLKADAAGSSLPAPKGTPVAPPAPPEPKKPLGTRILVFLDKAFDVEVSASVGPNSSEIQPQVRVDLGRILDELPPILPGTGHGAGTFAKDVGVMEGAYGLAVLAITGVGAATHYSRMETVGTDFWHYAEKHGPIGWGPMEFKDSNYGDPWVNDAGHPATYFTIGRLFRKRGYGFWKAFLGGLIADVVWEYMWENWEIPKSGHDILYVNLLGSLFGAGDDTGLAWGTNPADPLNPKGQYTEYYYRRPGTGWRMFLRTEPNGNYNVPGPDGSTPPPAKRPIFVSDVSLGAADEALGLTFFVTGVANNRTINLGDVHSPGDVVDDVRLGVSVDPTVVWRRLR